MSKRIIITGASGVIGTKLSERLYSKGYDITIFTRNISHAKSEFPNAKEYVEWDYNDVNSFQNFMDGAYAVIHLAGANLGAKRWNASYKKVIYDSRIKSSQNLVEAIKNVSNKPKIFINASAVGYYSDNGEELITEDTASGNDFLAKLCFDWERSAAKSTHYGCRHSSVRTGIALTTREGLVKKMMLPFKFFVGGALGNGKQWIPWIHLDDVISIYEFVLENEIYGPVNAASPNPVRMKFFADQLGSILNRPSYFNVPKFAIKLVAGEIADFILDSQKVLPKKLINSGFKFKFEQLELALNDIIINNK